jgi:hypothetical protein
MFTIEKWAYQAAFWCSSWAGNRFTGAQLRLIARQASFKQKGTSSHLAS